MDNDAVLAAETPEPAGAPTVESIIQKQIADAEAEAAGCRAWIDEYTARLGAAEERIAQLRALGTPPLATT